MKQVLVFLSEGFADWEAALVCAELNKPDSGFRITTLALSNSPVRSMGGLNVVPDAIWSDIQPHPDTTAMLILPGGLHWRDATYRAIAPLLADCHRQNIPIAAICDAVTFVASLGYLDAITHTGNTWQSLSDGAPDYRGQAYFIEQPAVSANGFITANGTAQIEFAHTILQQLGILHGEQSDEWYAFWKHGFYKDKP